MTPWWNAQESAWFGGIVGSALGVAGGLIGTLAGVLAPRGKAKALVLGLLLSSILLGAVLLLAGITTVTTGQPYHVWYPLVLCGGVATVVLSAIFPVIRTRYREAEFRRLEAEEFRRQ